MKLRNFIDEKNMHFIKRIQKSSRCINQIGRSFYVIVIFVGIIPILFSITRCKNDRTNELPSISYNDTAYLKIQFRNITDSLRIRINSAISFPLAVFARQFVVCDDDIYDFEVILSKPEYVEIISGDRLQNYLIPGDTLKLIIDYNPDRSFADMAVFEGEGGMIYKYFKAKQQMADSLLNQIEHHLDHPQILEILDTQKKEREAYLKEMLTLSPGKTAPMFYLQDENGSFHRLIDYRGRYVYISFWATWCKPCIEQFVDENRLVETYRGGNIEFITICLDQKPDLWIEIINERQLKGVKLLCKGNWDKRLQTDYNIIQLPHHVLIDRDGLIMENNCKGPIEIVPVLSELR